MHVIYILLYFFPEHGDFLNFKAVFLATGRGRRPTLRNLSKETSNLQLLQLFHLKESSGSSWGKMEDWMTILFPFYPKRKFRNLVQMSIQGVLRCQPEGRPVFYDTTLDLDNLGKLN